MLTGEKKVSMIAAAVSLCLSVAFIVFFGSYIKRPSPQKDTDAEVAKDHEQNKFTLRRSLDLTKHLLSLFTARFILLLISTNIGLCCLYTYIAFSTKLFSAKWGLEPELASRISSITTISAIVSSVPIGVGIDRFGHRLTILITLFAGMVGFFMLLAFIPEGTSIAVPIVTCLYMGFCYALFPSLQGSSFPICISEEALTIGFGMSVCSVNLLAAVFPLAVGALIDHTGGYFAGMLLLASVMGLSLVLAICCLVLDRLQWSHCSLQNVGVLFSPRKQRDCKQADVQQESTAEINMEELSS